MKLAVGDIWTVCRSAVNGFVEDSVLSHAAAMAFYAATSLAPILLIVLSIAGFAAGRNAAEVAISAQLMGLVGPDGADLLKATIESASQNKSVFASTIAVITLIIAASGVFGEMQSTLNLIWKVPAQKTSLLVLAKARVASLGLVAALGFLLLVSLAASAAISALGDFMSSRLPFGEIALSALNTIVSLLLVALLFGAIFKILPDRSLAWHDVRFGAVVTAVLFTVGKALIGWYLGTSAIASSYGAAGSLIVLLLWVFYSSAIFLFGAEITRAVAVRYGSRRDLRDIDSSARAPQAPMHVEGRTASLSAVAFIAAAGSLATLIFLGRRR
ncbi:MULTISPECIES: YihY/virulence factor BrkB family protein [Mesorhizobium]|uniref:YihY/virulence factor BrkB family protein n=1 Tax=Mesorhizobium denitrificans TaxID=2294114 RepID=A0A371XIY3_9HYPH|nr:MULTISPECIES: YihY/virulence factor BrkB family protein [Mesorhizobium]RFC69196.1 YihY/virulence factor BrkB family protein [Mesorhizobium denitrificans]